WSRRTGDPNMHVPDPALACQPRGRGQCMGNLFRGPNRRRSDGSGSREVEITSNGSLMFQEVSRQPRHARPELVVDRAGEAHAETIESIEDGSIPQRVERLIVPCMRRDRVGVWAPVRAIEGTVKGEDGFLRQHPEPKVQAVRS